MTAMSRQIGSVRIALAPLGRTWARAKKKIRSLASIDDRYVQTDWLRANRSGSHWAELGREPRRKFGASLALMTAVSRQIGSVRIALLHWAELGREPRRKFGASQALMTAMSRQIGSMRSLCSIGQNLDESQEENSEPRWHWFALHHWRLWLSWDYTTSSRYPFQHHSSPFADHVHWRPGVDNKFSFLRFQRWCRQAPIFRRREECCSFMLL